MAVPHMKVKTGGAGKAAPHAEYIAREGEYSKRLEKGEKLEHTEYGNMPKWAEHNPSEFWKAADLYERKNGSTYREFEIGLPRELGEKQRIELGVVSGNGKYSTLRIFTPTSFNDIQHGIFA